MKLDKSQQKMIAVLVIVFVVGWVFVQFVYLPQRGRLRKLRGELTALTEKLRDAQTKAEIAGSPEVGIRAMKEELALLEGKLSSEERVSTILKQLSEKAERFQIKILSITPQAPSPYLDSKGKPVSIGESSCEKLLINIDMECRYRALGEYLKALRDELEALVTVDGLKINKDERISPLLKVELILTTYSLSK